MAGNHREKGTQSPLTRFHPHMPIGSNAGKSKDGFRAARAVLAFILIVCCVCLSVILALTVSHTRDQRHFNAAFIDAFDLSAPALNPSGRLLRAFETRHRGIPLGPAPAVPFMAPDPAYLILPPPKSPE